jgi:predicted metal-dependent HD superfamily phosphohydrolase
MTTLEQRWAALGLGHPGATGVCAGLLARYAEPHRRYHGVAHLEAVLTTLDELSAARPAALERPAGPALAVRLAAWFHDAVYDPAAPDNEEASAALARSELLELDVAGEVIAAVERLVLATKTHTPCADAGAEALLDADLSVLGAPPEVYDRYAAAIRAEYAHVPDAAFRTGRQVVLAAFLARPTLFFTASGRARFEGPARANLRRELARLGG